MLNKYRYTIDNRTYFIVLDIDEKTQFEDRYGVCLVLWD